MDDTDHGDQAEFDAWKVRELTRIKRDREERIAYVLYFLAANWENFYEEQKKKGCQG